ncbi:MAG TPA: YheC/YheD family protein, partial [Thermaerobacter sp.]
LPLPDVIYNRATYPNLRRRARARRLRERMMELDRIPFVNTASGFPKWETYEALRFFAETRDLVPDAIRFGSKDSFARFLRRHRLAFLKENGGSGGAHVLRIVAVGGGWRVEGRSGRYRIRQRFSDPDELHAFLARLTRQGDWVLQEGVPLPRLRGRPWDVRLEAKKDENGEWQVPFIFIRWGHPEAVVTNEAQGGDTFLLSDFLARFGGIRELANLEATATRVGRLVALVLEARFGMQGEIGVDFGLDPQGRPRIFEANAKSTHTPVPGQTVPQARWPLRYAVWLAGRAWAGQETGLPLPVPAGAALATRTGDEP